MTHTRKFVKPSRHSDITKQKQRKTKKTNQNELLGNPEQLTKNKVFDTGKTICIIRNMSVKELTDKQKQFCLEYLKHFNQTKAYQTVYKVTIKQAEANSSRLIRNDKISSFLSKTTQKQCEKAEISIEWIIKELKQLYERCQASLSSPGAIAGATKQLELLGKYLGMFIDKTEHSGTVNINIIKFGDVKHKDTGS